jgi:hypothetical protein
MMYDFAANLIVFFVKVPTQVTTPYLLVMHTEQFHIAPGSHTGLGRYPRSIKLFLVSIRI